MQMRFSATTASLILAASGTLVASPAAMASWTLGNGEVLNMGDLFADGSDRTVYINDKVFHFESVATAHFTLRDISLIGFISNMPNGHGLRNVGFDIVGGFGDAYPGDGVIAEMNLQYSIAVAEGEYEAGVRIHDARLTFNGSAYGVGAYSRIDETLLDLDANELVGNLSVYDNFGPPRSTKLTDQVVWENGGFRALEVNKNLKFLAPTPESGSSASFIRQEFSQVPAPGAVSLLALAGVVGRRRRG
jgi:hypothetical protein